MPSAARLLGLAMVSSGSTACQDPLPPIRYETEQALIGTGFGEGVAASSSTLAPGIPRMLTMGDMTSCRRGAWLLLAECKTSDSGISPYRINTGWADQSLVAAHRATVLVFGSQVASAREVGDLVVAMLSALFAQQSVSVLGGARIANLAGFGREAIDLSGKLDLGREIGERLGRRSVGTGELIVGPLAETSGRGIGIRGLVDFVVLINRVARLQFLGTVIASRNVLTTNEPQQ